MKKVVTFCIIVLLSLSNAYAKKIEGTIIFNNDSVVHVTFDIPVTLIFRDIKFENIQSKIKYYNAANEKVKLTPDEVKEIRFKYRDEEIRMLSCFDNLNLLSMFSSSSHIFLKLKIDGNLKLFTYYFTQTTTNFGPNGTMTTSTYTTDKYILQKGKGELYRPNWITFKKDMKGYLSDCSSLVEKIDSRTYRSDDIEAIVQDYNNCK